MNKRNLILLFVVVCSIFSLHAFSAYNVQTVPNPKQWGQEYYVSNPDGVLQQYIVDYLNKNSQNLETMTEVEFCVVAIESFDEDSYADAYSFALDLFNTWGIGKKDKNNGVLLFLAKQSHDVQIITGGGVEGLLPDVTCGQILDDNISYLSEGDFDNGLIYISKDIIDLLTTDAAKAELLLGWKPKENHAEAFNYFIWGFIALILFAIVGYQRLKATTGQSKRSLQQQSAKTQTAAGCASWIFPFPLLLFYLYYKYARKHVQPLPRKCSKCGEQMKVISGEERLSHMTIKQRLEDDLKALEYEVWQCPECENVEIFSCEGEKAQYYDACPSCGAHAYTTIDRQTLQHATYTSAGQRRETKSCKYCGNVGTVIVPIPKLQYSAPTTSYTSSSGGGHRSSGGSWGGGRSFGGGAGRKF